MRGRRGDTAAIDACCASLPLTGRLAKKVLSCLPLAGPRVPMIDNLAILITCGAVVFVAFRAAVLDGQRPWFRLPRNHDAAAPPARTARR